MSKQKKESADNYKCPFCAEEIKKDAIKCKHCGSALNDEKAHELMRKNEEEIKQKKEEEKKKRKIHDRKVMKVIIVIILICLTPILWFITLPILICLLVAMKVPISNKKKRIVYVVVVILFFVLYAISLDEEPELVITQPSENFSFQTDKTLIEGHVEPINSSIKINTFFVQNNNGDFSYELPLVEGNNSIDVIAINGKASKTVNIQIQRILTEEELVIKQQQEEEANKKAEEAVKNAEEAKKKAEEAAAAEEAAWLASKAGRICAQHTEWTRDECQGLADNKIWIGMSYEMLITEFGEPDSTNVSNYGYGQRYQYCWHYKTSTCFYDDNDDGIIDSYN